MQAKVLYLSSWQHPGGSPIDMKAVRDAGYVGVLIKSTQGEGYVNPFFHDDAVAALAIGLLVGAVPYAKPVGQDAVKQAQLHLSTIAGVDLALGQWIDWDDPETLEGTEAAQWLQDWFAAVAHRTQILGMYCNNDQYLRVPGIPFGHKFWAGDDIPTLMVKPFIQFDKEVQMPGNSSRVDVQILTNVRGINGAATAPIPYQGKVIDMQQVQEGDSGQVVKVLQHYLNNNGHEVAVDGDFGPQTTEAVKAYQESQSIATDGIVGPITWGKLIG